MKQFKLTFLLSVLMSMVGGKAFAYDAEIDGIYYNFVSGIALVTYYSDEVILGEYNNARAYKGDIVIPESVTYNGKNYPVARIEPYAFIACSGLTSIEIPNSVWCIDDYAFSGCSSLTSIEIPNSVTSIGNYAFYYCSGLTSIEIPNSVTSIGNYAFYYCSGLTSINVHSGNTNYDSRNNCNAIIETSSNTLIAGCKNTIIPNSVTSIGNYAFYGCYGLTSIEIPNNVTTIGYHAFEGCRGLKSVEIGNGVKELPNDVFATGNELISLTIGSAVLSISSNAFSSKPIKTIWLTNTPPEGYTYASGTVNYVANELYKYLSNTTVYPFLSSLFEVNGVKYVPVSPSDRTCDAIDCTYDKSVEKINIGKTVTFKGVEMAVKGVKHYTCYENSYINGATLSFEGDLGDYAFSHCTALTTATLGSKITSIGKDAFYDCSSLQEITIPNAVKSLGEYAFYRCSGMTSAKIGNGITAINESTFSGCSALKDIQIGTDVKTIDTYSFSGCSSLPMIEIPKNVTDIKDYVFRSCSQLKNVNIADREEVLNLGSNGSSPLFAHCPLEEVYIGGNISYSTGSNKGYSPFYRNTSLQTVTITDKETEISTNEFYGCTSLKNVSIGDGVTTIGDWAFSGCSSLENFSYGSMVNSIGQEAFSDCTAMTKLVSHAATPPVCGSQALDDINKWACTLSVPKGATASYQAADQWKEFFFINDELEIATLLGDANGDGVVNVTDIVEIVNDILGHPSAKFDPIAADVNGDGVVNVTDIVSVVNIILSDPVAARELLGDDEEDE